MREHLKVVLAILGLLLLVSCFPTETYYGFVVHEAAEDGSYNCRFVNVDSTFAGSTFHSDVLDAENPKVSSGKTGGVPGFPVTGTELEVSLDCFDEMMEHKGTTIYRLAVTNARYSGTMVIWNFVPHDWDSSDCVAPVVQTGVPMFCASVEGLTPVAL